MPTLRVVFIVLLLAFLCVPVAEIFVIIRVAGDLGIGETIGLLVVVSVVGAWMVRRSGLGVLGQIRARLNRGELPGKELVDGLLILVAGLLMLTPGFLTDAVGLLLLVPPSRLVVRTLLVRRFGKRLRVAGWTAGPGGFGGFGPAGFGGGAGYRRSPGSGFGFNSRSGRGDVRDVHEARELREDPNRGAEPDED